MARLLPLFLRLEAREVLVVGAGAVAARKIDDLIAAGARVRVIAPRAHADVQAHAEAARLALHARAFEERDVEGAWLVIAATDDPETQRAVAVACEARRVFVVAVDDPSNASAYGAATLHRDPLTVAISSSGEAPALVRLLREILEEVLPEPSWIDEARALRAKWKAEKTPMGSRFAELVRAFKARAR